MHKRSLLHAADVLAPQPIHVAGYFDVEIRPPPSRNISIEQCGKRCSLGLTFACSCIALFKANLGFSSPPVHKGRPIARMDTHIC